jgi:CRISPR-associated protein Cmr6
MDDPKQQGGERIRFQRWYAPEGSRWKVRFIVRDGAYLPESAPLGREVILDQVKTALWWFCQLGGAGSKSRKGFGCFADPPELSGFEGGRWKTKGREFRAACGLPETTFDPALAESPALQQMTDLSRSLLGNEAWLTIRPSESDVWQVLDRLGSAAQSFAQAPASTGHGKHCPEKIGLGLPRSIDRSPSRKLRGVKGDRHAAPILYHTGRDAGGLVVRICAFPSRHLRESSLEAGQGLQRHTTLLRQLLEHLRGVFNV